MYCRKQTRTQLRALLNIRIAQRTAERRANSWARTLWPSQHDPGLNNNSMHMVIPRRMHEHISSNPSPRSAQGVYWTSAWRRRVCLHQSPTCWARLPCQLLLAQEVHSRSAHQLLSVQACSSHPRMLELSLQKMRGSPSRDTV